MYSAWAPLRYARTSGSTLFCSGSAGWSKPKNNPSGPRYQLFDLEQDPAEKTNLFGKHPEIERLTALLKQYIKEGQMPQGPIKKRCSRDH